MTMLYREFIEAGFRIFPLWRFGPGGCECGNVDCAAQTSAMRPEITRRPISPDGLWLSHTRTTRRGAGRGVQMDVTGRGVMAGRLEGWTMRKGCAESGRAVAGCTAFLRCSAENP